MQIRNSLFGLLVLAAIAGCPNSMDTVTPREACEGSSVALCERVYACLSAQELAVGGFPTQEAACVTQLDDKEGCAAQTLANACQGNETFHAAKASTCLDQLEGIDCGQLRTKGFDISKAAPACPQICSID